jgi:hypothetical protein
MVVEGKDVIVIVELAHAWKTSGAGCVDPTARREFLASLACYAPSFLDHSVNIPFWCVLGTVRIVPK